MPPFPKPKRQSMKKPKASTTSPKSSAQIAAAQTAKREADTETAVTACRKVGRSVSFSFFREIKSALKCGDSEADAMFASLLSAGKIVQGGETGGVKIYCVK